MSRTTSGIPASADSSAWITMSTPSPSTFSSPSVTRQAISIRASLLQVEAGHLAVDPHQTVIHPGSLFARVRPRG